MSGCRPTAFGALTESSKLADGEAAAISQSTKNARNNFLPLIMKTIKNLVNLTITSP
jgi:hypothetical protein